MRGRIVHGGTPAELIAEYTGAVGRMRELPAWALKGAIVGMQGGPAQVRTVWNQLEALDVPLSAFWLQVGKINSSFVNPCHPHSLPIHPAHRDIGTA